MTDRDMLEFIATQVAKLAKDVDIIKNTMATKQELAEVKQELAEFRNTMATKQELAEIRNTMATKEELAEVKDEVASIKTIVVKIENEHGEKLGALLNGYKLNAERLDRVESRLDEHDRILKRLGWKS